MLERRLEETMTEQHEQVHGSGRADTTRDERKEDGLAVFEERAREGGGSADQRAAEEAFNPGSGDSGPETSSKD